MKSDIAQSIVFRDVCATDMPFILDSFRRNLLSNMFDVGLSGRHEVFASVDWLAAEYRGGLLRWKAATLKTNPKPIVAWAVANKSGEVLFCYVCREFRRWGIGTDLV